GVSFHLNAKPLGSTMNGTPTVCFSKRAITNASPRLAAVTLPSLETAAALSLLERNTARQVTSRSVQSEYFARTVSCWVSPVPSITAEVGKTSSESIVGTAPGSAGAPASRQPHNVG